MVCSKNNMKNVADMLGVKLGEEFVIKNGNDKICADDYIIARLNDSGLDIYATSLNNIRIGSYIDGCQILGGLLNGTYKIIPKAWKPKYNETYYSIGPGGLLEPGCWMNDFIDIAMYKLGNCYPTVEEASANVSKWMAFYDSDNKIKF